MIEAIAIGLGISIAKGALKLWFEDDPVMRGAATGLIDVLREQTDDLRAQRTGSRQFEQIADRVAESLQEVIEADAAQMPEQRIAIVIQAAQAAVDGTKYPVEVLAKKDLDPSLVAELYLDTLPRVTAGEEFSVEELQLCERIIRDSAQYVVDIAGRMPSFTEKTLAEVLRRETWLIGRVDELIGDFRRVRKGGVAAEVKFEGDYRLAVIRRLDELELFGVDVSETSRRYKLSVAYITLLVERGPSNETGAADVGAVEDGELSETVPVDVALASSDHLFVKGAAGCGKSTLLKWVAVMAASRSLEGELEDWNDCVPFFIRLRAFSHSDLPTPQDFPALVSQSLAGAMPDGWVHRLLDKGRALVLVDGLDEIGESRREEVREWLADLTGNYAASKFILSSRPYAAKEGWLNADGFAEVELQDMQTTDVSQFVSHWHDAVAESQRHDDDRAALHELGESLTDKIRSTPSFSRLATTPILCAIMCALHRHRQEDLPADRVALYRACVEMFLRRDTERKILTHDYPVLSDRQKIELLSDLAFFLIRQGWSQVDSDSAESRFERMLGSLGALPVGTTAENVRRLFVERSGILREPQVAVCDFPHRTFQEYLAAVAAVAESSWGELVRNAHDDQWREVVVLAAGRRPGRPRRS